MRVGSQLAAYYEMNLLDFDLYMSGPLDVHQPKRLWLSCG